MANEATNEWQIEFYVTESGEVPARDFLDEVPQEVSETMLATLDVIAATPPPAFPASNYWHAMRNDMKGIYEVRDEYDGRLYRIFCVLDRNAPEYGLSAPTVALLGGGAKAVRTEMSARKYAEIRASRDDYLATRRVA